MRVLRPGQRVRLSDGDGYESDGVVGKVETLHLYEDGSHAYTVSWWDDRRLASATFFPTAIETLDEPEYLEVTPIVS
jgi:hypothetical protein